MMVFIYIVNRFFYRFFDFLRHWYIKSLFLYFQFVIDFFLKLERKVGLIVNLRYFFQPLYQDYTLLGYLLGIFFRSLRTFLSGVLYVVLFLVFLIIYLIWVFIPIFLVVKILNL